MEKIVEYELEFIVSFKSKDPILNGAVNEIGFGGDLYAATKQFELMKKDKYEKLHLYKREIKMFELE